MAKSPFLIAVAVLWLALPTTLANYWLAWDRLPAKVATRFDTNWDPIGWGTPGQSLTAALVAMTGLLVVLTPVCLFARAANRGAAWFGLTVTYFVMGVLWWVTNWIVWRSLPG